MPFGKGLARTLPPSWLAAVNPELLDPLPCTVTYSPLDLHESPESVCLIQHSHRVHHKEKITRMLQTLIPGNSKIYLSPFFLLFFSSPLPSPLCSISPPLYFSLLFFSLPLLPSSSPSLQHLHCSPLSFSLFHILIRSHITASTIVTRHQLKPGTNQCIVIRCLQKQRRHSSVGCGLVLMWVRNTLC